MWIRWDADNTCFYSFGYAEFASGGDAKEALEALSGAEYEGRELRVDVATPRTPGGGTPGGRGRGGTPGGRGGRGGKYIVPLMYVTSNAHLLHIKVVEVVVMELHPRSCLSAICRMKLMLHLWKASLLKPMIYSFPRTRRLGNPEGMCGQKCWLVAVVCSS